MRSELIPRPDIEKSNTIHNIFHYCILCDITCVFKVTAEDLYYMIQNPRFLRIKSWVYLLYILNVSLLYTHVVYQRSWHASHCEASHWPQSLLSYYNWWVQPGHRIRQEMVEIGMARGPVPYVEEVIPSWSTYTLRDRNGYSIRHTFMLNVYSHIANQTAYVRGEGRDI